MSVTDSPRRLGRRALCLVVLVSLTGGACTDAAPPSSPGSGSTATPHVTPTPIARVTEPPGNWFETACALPLDQLLRIRRGLYPGRSPDVVYVPREPNHFPNNHSGPWDYLQDVPLLLYGPGFIRNGGRVEGRPSPTVADLAPTFAELLGTPWPQNRIGRVLDEALLPKSQRPDPPRLIVTLVWDGGGRSVLDAWPQSWPRLAELADAGTFFANASVGSSPSITPAIHATIGTGAFPNDHGVVDILISENGAMVPVFADKSQDRLELPTLADLFDRRTGNRAEIGMLAYKGWHVGMIGHGAGLEGADKDFAAIVGQDGSLSTNTALYSLPKPTYGGEISDDVEAADASDGRRDGTWLGNEVLDSAQDQRDTPAWVTHQTQVLFDVLEQNEFGRDETPDLFYTNYKQIDQVGHRWGMLEPEMRAVIAVTDAQLRRIVSWLDERVGKNRWVLALTADHGPSPDLKSVGGWPLHMEAFRTHLGESLGRSPDEVFLDTRASGLWFRDPATTEADAVEIAEVITDYRISDDVPDGQTIPPQFEKRRTEPVFSAAFPARSIDDVIRCRQDKG